MEKNYQLNNNETSCGVRTADRTERSVGSSKLPKSTAYQHGMAAFVKADKDE
jgi:hypothetical protein